MRLGYNNTKIHVKNKYTQIQRKITIFEISINFCWKTVWSRKNLKAAPY